MLEDKMNFFSKIIYERIDEELQKAQAEWELDRDRQLEEFLRYSAEKRGAEIFETEIESNRKANELTAVAKLQSRQTILQQREQLVDRAITAVMMKLQEFTETPSYGNFLLSLAKAAVTRSDGEECVMYLAEKDFERFGSFIEEEMERSTGGKIKVKPSPNRFTGGLKLESNRGRFRLDSTFEEMLRDNRSTIGKKMSDSLGQAVNFNYE